MTAYASFRCARAVFALGAICCVAATAAEPSTVQFHGFIGQSYIHTDRNQFFGHSTGNGHFQFRELGANVSWQAQPNLLFAAQAVSRHAGDGDNGEPRLDYALADYGIVSNEQYSLGMRSGSTTRPGTCHLPGRASCCPSRFTSIEPEISAYPWTASTFMASGAAARRI